jgi:hypothetical protein
MAAGPLTPQELQHLRDLAAQWGKIVARRAFGADGPGLQVDFATFEAIADAVACGLSEGTLTTLLEQQAQALGRESPCPACGQLCPLEREPRPLTCHSGTLTYHEPVGHCPACRRDFFPSALRSAPGRP